MKITSLQNDTSILNELGKRIEKMRVNRNLSQAEMAEMTGISKRTIERLEAGAPSSTKSLLSVLRALDVIDGLELLLPQALPGPIELADSHGRGRVRASKPRKPKSGPSRQWAWGDKR